MDNWGSKSILGEKYWSDRKTNPVAKHHHSVNRILTILQTVGGATLFIGLWKLNLSLTIIGSVLVYMAKMWFLDRMVWIFEDMQTLEK